MKAFNLVATAIAGAFAIIMTLSLVAELLLGENAAIVVLPVAFFVGFSARTTAEKFLGYTLYEALKNEDSGENK
jgi:hypothetical protein